VAAAAAGEAGKWGIGLWEVRSGVEGAKCSGGGDVSACSCTDILLDRPRETTTFLFCPVLVGPDWEPLVMMSSSNFLGPGRCWVPSVGIFAAKAYPPLDTVLQKQLWLWMQYLAVQYSGCHVNDQISDGQISAKLYINSGYNIFTSSEGMQFMTLSLQWSTNRC
jgi:hypothetical protein